MYRFVDQHPVRGLKEGSIKGWVLPEVGVTKVKKKKGSRKQNLEEAPFQIFFYLKP